MASPQLSIEHHDSKPTTALAGGNSSHSSEETSHNTNDAHTEHSTTGPHVPGMQGNVFFDNHFLPISNVLLASWIVMLILIIAGVKIYLGTKAKKISSRLTFVEMVIEFFYDQFYSFLQSKKLVHQYFFILATIFILIVTSNLFGLLIDFLESFYPTTATYLRSPNSDLNTTLAIAISAIIIVHFAGVKEHGIWGYFKRFIFNFHGHSLVERIINFFVGFLEIISEISKVVSLSFRLFGNIFAGTILLVIIVYLLRAFPVLLPLPFFLLELLVAFVQALVFTGLVLGYLKGASDHH